MALETTALFKHIDSEEGIVLEGDLLKKYQGYLLGIADDIVSVFEKYNINYNLSGGSALGAVRHHGFIPWDDDMDFNIFGKDHERFVECFNKEYGDKYNLQYYKSPNYGLAFMRVRKRGTVYRNHLDVGEKEENSGFSMDIFIMENVFDNVILRNIHGILCMFCGLMLSSRKFYSNRSFFKELSKKNPEIKRSVNTKIWIGRLISFISLEKWAEITDKCHSLCKNNKSKYVTIPTGRRHYFNEMYLRKNMEETIVMPFEGRNWKVAKGYDAYFKALYGNDYMTPPPEDKREKHVILELKFPEDMKAEQVGEKSNG